MGLKPWRSTRRWRFCAGALHPHSRLARNPFHCQPKRSQQVKRGRMKKGKGDG